MRAQNEIKRFRRKTPLLLASFSSRGYPVKEVFGALAPFIPGAYLISAYDIHYDQLSVDSAYRTPICFVDSGGYEAMGLPDPMEPYTDWRTAQPWSEERYHHTVSRLGPISDLVLTTFDHYGDIKDQFEVVQKTVDAYPEFGISYLVKPQTQGQPIDIGRLIDALPRLPHIDVLGFTEKELGGSMTERARSIRRVRDVLTTLGMQTPIHVFGSLDPLGATTYYRVGADIFDGLTWLRFAWHDGTLEYIRTASPLQGEQSTPDDVALFAQHRRNLHALATLEAALPRLGQEKHWGLWERYHKVSDQIVESAGGDL